MLKKCLFLTSLLLIFGFTVPLSAQDQPTLRELADQRDFYVGAAVQTWFLEEPGYGDTLVREFNLLVPEYESKMCAIETTRGIYDFNATDTLLAFAEANEMVFRFHTLIWHACTPEWFAEGEFSRDEAILVMRDYIYTVMGRYRGRAPMWDVVNEAFEEDGTLRDTPWLRAIGEDYIELAFQFAHEADPDALLYYNDYNTESINAKSDAVYALVSDLVERGVPIHGVGLQTHIAVNDVGVGRMVDLELMAQNIERLGELGLQVQITEIDVAHYGEPTEEILQQQAAVYRQIFDVCLASAACNAFITWGVGDAHSWLRSPEFSNNPDNAPLLFDTAYEPKPAYFAVLDALARDVGADPILSDAELEALFTATRPAEVELPEPTFSSADQLAPDSVDGIAYYAAFPVAITLDGEVEDWAGVPRVTVDSGPTLPAGHNTSITFAAAADAENFYFLAEVTDDDLVAGEHDPASEWYMEDSAEFYLNATDTLDLSAYQPGVAQIAIPAANIGSDETIIAGGQSNTVDVQAVVIATETGYRVEASVPLTTDVWTITPETGTMLGFQVHLNGASDASGRDTKLIWSAADVQDASWNDPSVFGRLIFWQREE